MSAIRSPIEGNNSLQGELATTSARLRAPKGALTATFDHLERHCSTMWVARAVLQERMKPTLRNYIQTVSDRGKQIPEAYQLNGQGDISSSETALTRDIRILCARTTKHLYRVHQDFSDSGKS